MLNHGASVNRERWEAEHGKEDNRQRGKKASDKTTEELMADFGEFGGFNNALG